SVRLGHGLQQAPVIDRGGLRPRIQRPLGDRQRWVRNDQLGVDYALEPEPMAAMAAAVRRVEGEDPRLQLRHRRPTVQAGKALRKEHIAVRLLRCTDGTLVRALTISARML